MMSNVSDSRWQLLQWFAIVCICNSFEDYKRWHVKVCIVIIRNRSLHSAMSFYLLSLAVSDLAIIILGRIFMKSGHNFHRNCWGEHYPPN